MTTHLSKPAAILSGGRGVGSVVRGPALVSQHGFGVRYDLDPERGIVSNPDHDLYGQALAGRILFFTMPKGGVAASWALAGLARRNLAPLGIVFRRASPIFVQGAIFAGLPILHDLDQDPGSLIKSGEVVELLPHEGRVKVYRD